LKPWLLLAAAVGPARKRSAQGHERAMSRQRLECVELAPAFSRVERSKSAGKPDALQRLRPVGGPDRIPSASAGRSLRTNDLQQAAGLV